MEILSGVAVQGCLYGFDLRDFETRSDGTTRGLFKCVDMATGQERWRTHAVGHASLVACGGRLVLLNEHGALIVAEANSDRYQEIARWTAFPEHRCWTPPAMAGRFMVLRSREDFLCLDIGAVGVDSANRPAMAATRVQSGSAWQEAVSTWFARRYGRAFYAPTWSDQGRWFLGCLVGIVLPQVGIGLLRPPRGIARQIIRVLRMAPKGGTAACC
jgi:hypothetical protein